MEIDEFLANLPPTEKVITKKLRSLILEADPRIQEVFAYGVPYFFHNRRICFVWPASQVPCGYMKPQEQYVSLGFCYGNMLSNEQGLLQKENRKQVCTIKFSSLKEIDETIIREIVQEAILIDDSFRRSKPSKNQKSNPDSYRDRNQKFSHG